MTKKAKKISLDCLSPTQFENLIFDLMVLRGMSNVQWRTPGADGGRDIEGETSVVDFSGHQRVERWYVECKRYKTAIGWPTIYEKIGHADAASADVLLMCTQSTFSPTAITRAQEWNSRQGSVRIRLWPKHDLELRLGEHSDLQVKYGLSDSKDQSGSSITQLSLATFKALSSYCASRELKGEPPDKMLEAALAISSLVHKKMEDIELSGKVKNSVLRSEKNDFIEVIADPGCRVDRHGVQAYAHLLAALVSRRIKVQSRDEFTCSVRLEGGRKIGDIVDRYNATFSSICFWSSFEADVSSDEVLIKQRESLP